MINEQQINNVFNILSKMLNVELKWDFAEDGEMPNEINGVFLKPEEAKQFFGDGLYEPIIMLNPLYNVEDIELVCVIAHESFHWYQWINQKKNPIYKKEFNDGFKMKGDFFHNQDYLNRQIEIEAYVFSNEFIKYVFDAPKVMIEVIKYLPADKVEQAKNMALDFINKFHKKVMNQKR